MLCSSQRGIIQWAKRMLACAVWFPTLALLCHPCQAQPAVPSIPQSTDWISGPANGNLGKVATIRIPQGYKFIDDQGARTVLEHMANPIPKGLAGILSPESGGWLIVFKFADTGFVKDDGYAKMDPSAILKNIRKQIELQKADSGKQGPSAISGVDWELTPLYDAQDHTLEWALRAQSQAQPFVSHTVRLLSRHGALDAIVVRPYKGFSDLAPLKQLAKGVSFNTGERYADFQKGDKLSGVVFAELITAEDIAKPAVASAATSASGQADLVKSPWFWAGVGFVICAAVLLVVLVARKPGRRDIPRAAAAEPTQVAAGAAIKANGSKSVNLAATLQPSAATLASKAEPARKPVNGKHQNLRRKKMFDYNRYFNDLNSAVSSHVNQIEPSAPTEYPAETSRLAAPASSPAPTAHIQPILPAFQSEVIAHQKAIIEEQKRLIQEQTRLIEEKSRLIAEKNQLLKMQSEFIENKLL